MASVFFVFSVSQSQAEEVVELDSDFDGKIDQWQHKTADGLLTKTTYDTNQDGKVDQIEVFGVSGKLKKAEFVAFGPAFLKC